MRDDGIFQRTREAYQALNGTDEDVRANLAFACGFLMGADLAYAAAAVVLAWEAAYPDHPVEGHMAAIAGKGPV